MSAGDRVPEGIDASVATAARMYDYWLGGHSNFAADRVAALKVAEHSPEVPLIARTNRAFLGRAVRFLAAEAGIRQFIDLGTGLPTRGSVHEVAQAIDPEARIVYVDNDPMVLIHSRALKTGGNTAVIHADLRDVDAILSHRVTQRLIDFSQPLAVLFVSVLHFIGGDEAAAAVQRFTAAAAPGSYLVLSHAAVDPDPAAAAAGMAVYAGTANPSTLRTREEILGFFAGLEVLDPGLVPVEQWRPAGAAPATLRQSWILGGIGRLPADHVRVPVTVAPHPPAPPQAPAPRGSQQPAGSAGAGESGAGQPPPPGIDASIATAARMYDYWLGGHSNFAADRIAAHRLAQLVPEAPLLARENRAFLRRAVRFLTAEAGVRQFLDLGTGLPTSGNVHQVAQQIAPETRVVYVDNDPMVLAHSRALKTGANAAVIQADLRDVDTVLGHPDTQRLIDLSEPLAVLLVSVLSFITDDAEASAAVSAYMSAAAAGSYLALSHVTSDPDPDLMAAGASVYATTANPASARPHSVIARFFSSVEILEPGLVPLRRWRPDEPEAVAPRPGWMIGGVGRKRL